MFHVKQEKTMIYFDNAATSWPKPCETKSEVLNVMERYGANPGRGAYPFAKETAAYMESARRELADFLGVTPEHLIFTSGNTESANLVLKSALRPGEHLIYTSLEHNAVRRAAHYLAKNGAEITMVSGGDAETLLRETENAIRENTRLIAVNHGSNVTGAVQPLAEAAKLGAKHGIPVFGDLAQTAGVLDFSPEKAGLAFAAYAGHKSLLGYGGVGALYVRDPLSLRPLLHGGTGILSYLKDQPRIVPGGFEAGTRNLLGVGSLLGGVRYIKKRSMAKIREHETELAEFFAGELKKMPHIRVYRREGTFSLPVVSLNVAGMSGDQVASYLARKGDICVRAGLHCAPDAHAALGTEHWGTVRFSFGPFNTIAEAEEGLRLLKALK